MSVYLRLLLAHLPAFLIGLALVDLLWPRRGLQDWPLKLFLAPGLGWGISSALFFLWSLAFSPFAAAFDGVEWLLALGLLGLDIFLGRDAWRGLQLRGLITRIEPGAWAAGLVFVLGAVLLWQRADMQPNGNFDAYAIWNLRARFIFLSDAQTWTQSFSPELSWWVHADYPLLWPLTLLRGYLSQGRLLTQAGVLQAVIFAWATLGLVMAGLYRLNSAWQAWLGGLAVLGLPWFVQFSAFQQADVPLVYYSLAGLLLLLLAVRGWHPGLLALAGLAAGCAAWTKNDGIAFLLAAALPVALWGLAAHGKRSAWTLAAFGLGLLLPVVALTSFKLLLAPPGDLVGGQSAAEIASKLLDLRRGAVILGALAGMIPGLGGLPWPELVGGLLYLLLAGRVSTRSGWRLMAVPGLTLLVYCGVYWITPQPLEWHLNYSLDRLSFHVFVPALFLVLCLTRSPEELFGLVCAERQVSAARSKDAD
jgi:hypothetical protein